MYRYATQLEVVGPGKWSNDRLQQLLEDVHLMVESKHSTTDWLTIIIYMLCDASTKR